MRVCRSSRNGFCRLKRKAASTCAALRTNSNNRILSFAENATAQTDRLSLSSRVMRRLTKTIRHLQSLPHVATAKANTDLPRADTCTSANHNITNSSANFFQSPKPCTKDLPPSNEKSPSINLRGLFFLPVWRLPTYFIAEMTATSIAPKPTIAVITSV